MNGCKMLNLNPNLENYILNHTEPESELLKDLNRQTNLKMIYPRMLSGHLQGRILSMISKMISPEYILEIGTFTGYSAICLSEGLTENGKLITIEIDDEIAEFAMNYFEKANLEKKIELLIGDATEKIKNLNQIFDLVFIDGDKKQYADYYDLIFDKIASRGYIIVDNVLWSGKVIKPIEENDFDTKAIVDFNERISNDNRVENVLFPVRDGLMIIRKKL